MTGVKKRICLVVASEMTVTAFLKEQIIALSKHYNVSLVVNTRQADFAEANGLPVTLIPLAIQRAINPIADFLALFSLLRVFRQNHFDLVHSVTPKAGLLAMLAGKLAGVPLRMHTFTGQVWATRTGFLRLLLKSMDRLLAASATHLLADSTSQRKFLIDQNVTRTDKLKVLAEGSISGVNAARFKPESVARKEIRAQLGIDEHHILLLFLGRLNRDKGVLDLATAFAHIANENRQVHLLFVGPDEGSLHGEIESICAAYKARIHFIHYTRKPESFFAASDVFCLPSYREGFGSVVIEAAACGIPAIGSRIYGVSDAIEEGKSGFLFEAGNVDELSTCLLQLLTDESLRRRMGEDALLRARRDFSSERVTQAWLEYYDALL